jgi:hypothetical protein
VADQEEDVEGLEGQDLNHKQISYPDGPGMVGEEGAPALAGRRSSPAAAVAADGAGADGDAKLEQLAADAFGAPMRVLARHGGDQRSDLGRQSRSLKRMMRLPVPEQPPALAMPPQHSLRPVAISQEDDFAMVAPDLLSGSVDCTGRATGLMFGTEGTPPFLTEGLPPRNDCS